MTTDILSGILIPFAGTSLGAACVFVMRRNSMNRIVQKALTGFAAGVMVAASIWSLLIPAMNQSAELGKLAFLPAAVGFWLGILFLLFLDHIIPHLHMGAETAEGPHTQLKRTTMLVLAVTLHNIPEGMAVGVVYAGYRMGNGDITAMGAFALALGIAIQNLPEQGEGVHLWCTFRYRGTDRRAPYRGGGRFYRSGTAVFIKLCGGSHDLCGGGRTDPGDVRRGALQCGNTSFRGRIHGHDDARCGIGVGNMEADRK